MHKILTWKWTLLWAGPLLCMMALVGCNAAGIPTGGGQTLVEAVTPTAVAYMQPAATPPSTGTQEPSAPTFAVPTSLTAQPPRIATTTPLIESTRQATSQPTGQATEQATVVTTGTVLALAERERIFNQVWDTVDQNYLYPDFHGVDWNALKAKYEPLVQNAPSSDAFYNALVDMVDALNDGHSRYESPTRAKEEVALESGNADYVGIGIISSPVDKSVGVVYVFPNSPAEKAGIKRRDRIIRLDGTPFVDPAKEAARIRGPEGSTVTLTVVSPEQVERRVSIVRGRVSGAVVPTSSRLSTDPSIGYLIIPTLSTDDMDVRTEAELNRLLNDSPDLKGLVVDLRGNGGGFRTILQSILGDFVSGQVGTFFNQTTSYPLTIAAKPLADKLSGVAVVLLVDQGTESYAEVMSASLQEKGRARVVGVTTAGNTETIYAYNLEDGSRLWCAQEGFKVLDGTNLEGRGVIPDVTVNVDWTAFQEADDPQILKAVELLHGKP
ncbi:MAG: S41 family peptidase [Chloroflexota bacterium]